MKEKKPFLVTNVLLFYILHKKKPERIVHILQFCVTVQYSGIIH